MTRRRLIRTAAVVVAALIAVVMGLTAVLAVTYVRRPFPDHDGTVELPGLGAQVSVLRDGQGVPQIYADDPADLFRAQGYVHAQDRFFEMDLRRHITSGRLAELVGDNGGAVEADTVVRTLGWRRVAEQELTKLDPQTRSALDAYADGVNDYLKGRSPSEVSVDYTMLDVALPAARIEPWTALDSLTWLKAVAWDLRANYDDELARARAYANVKDVTRVDKLFPAYPYAQHAPITSPASTAVTPPDATTSTTESTSTAKTAGTTTAEGMTTAKAAGTTTAKEGTTAPARRAADDLATAMAGGVAQQAFEAASVALRSVPGMVGSTSGVGSNSWVVSGDRTATGKPLLANDPHLATSAPGVWVQGGLHCRTVSAACPYDVAGYTFSGLPGIVIGHNQKIAWGLTNLGADVTDFYLEKLEGDTVLLDGVQRPVTSRNEVIEVAGGEAVTIRIRSTRHGPLISDAIAGVRIAGGTAPAAEDAPARDDAGYGVSLAWTALTPGRSMDAVLAIDTATDLKEFRAGAALLDAPSQNLVYADVDGHIAYQAPGRIPIRDAVRDDGPVPADGTWPQPGWLSDHDWDGYLPFASLPAETDPAEGFIVAANQAVTRPDDGPRLTSDYDYGYRSQRIRALLAGVTVKGRTLTAADMNTIQNDTWNPIAPVLVPMMLRTGVDSFTAEAVGLLKNWDYRQPADSAAAAYFNAVWKTLLQLTFGDELPEGYRPDGGDRWFEAVETLMKSPTDPWWDDRRTPDVVETRDEVVRQAMVKARLTLTSTLGKDPTRWQWGRLHTLTLQQQPFGDESQNGLLRRLVNLGPYPAPGGSSIVDALAWNAGSADYHVTAGPSMRMVVDLDDLDRSRWVNQTGSSGHPGNEHYGDQVGTWLKGGSYSWPFSEKAVRAASEDELVLRPSGEDD